MNAPELFSWVLVWGERVGSGGYKGERMGAKKQMKFYF